MSKAKNWQYLHPDILAKIDQATGERVVLPLKSVPPRAVIKVRTKNSLYQIALVRKGSGRGVVRGGKNLEVARRVLVRGSRFRDSSMIKINQICVGLHLEMGYMGNRVITTSPIKSVVVEDNPELWQELMDEAQKAVE